MIKQILKQMYEQITAPNPPKDTTNDHCYIIDCNGNYCGKSPGWPRSTREC